MELFCPWASDGQPKALRLEEPRKLIVSPLCWTKQKGYAEKQALLQDEAMLHCGQRRRALAALVWGHLRTCFLSIRCGRPTTIFARLVCAN